jgi:hypothetical protein
LLPRRKLLANLLLRNKALPWATLFLSLCSLNVQSGGNNAASRLAGLRAISEGHSLNIDLYKAWTEDWSRSPDGHYYPNKAPGGVLLGLPVFMLVDGAYNIAFNPPKNIVGQRPRPPIFELYVFNMLTQALPFALLVLYAVFEFGGEMGEEGTLFFVLAALFGNTASIYMNTYFGHGLAAVLLLGSFIAWLKRRYPLSGALMAACLLTEYGTGFVIPFYLAATFVRERGWRPLFRIALGSLPFVAIWVWYHQVAFGNPLTPAIRFSNPDMIIKPTVSFTLWGMFSVPSPLILYKLLFGPERGLLFTQPWLLGALPFFFKQTRLPKGTQLFLCGGLAGLLWMNASIGGWEGGWTVGPRYLSQVFPALALALALGWKEFSRPSRVLLLFGLGASLLFRLAAFPLPVLAPPRSLWDTYWLAYSSLPFDSIPYQFLAAEIPLCALTVVWFLQARKATVCEGALWPEAVR